MGAKIASFLATLILSIPLAAIGLMAVFGIPQLVPANSGPMNARDTVIRGVQDAFQWGEKPVDHNAPGFEDEAPRFNSEFADSYPPAQPGAGHPNEAGRSPSQQHPFHQDAQNQYASNSQASPGNRPGGRFQWDESNDAAQNAPQRGGQAPHHWSEIPGMTSEAATRPSMGDRNSATRSAALNDVPQSGQRPSIGGMHETGAMSATLERGNPAPLQNGSILTWRQASAKLNDLGVKNYHLERGVSEGTFLFVCMFSPGDSPQVVHRFEAEADDPLIAVNQVLQQIDRWMRSRYAASNFPTRNEAFSSSAGSSLR